MDNRFVTSDIADRQQHEQYGQVQENKLQRADGFQRTKEHTA